ncbi:MAG: PA14 domain-containing protein [Chitinivibrionales bacterium]|nr:PA14 domain-containing protein [Chitinivibrionales bacterium]
MLLFAGTLPVLAAVAATAAGLRPPDPTGQLEQGLNYKYYEGSWTALPDFATLAPVKSDTCASFDLSEISHGASNFGLVYTGFISILLDGDYTFYVNSRDGGKLFIGDSLIVNNDGVRSGALEKGGSIGLAAGMHRIMVAYFNATPPPALLVSYACASFGIAKQAVAAGALYRPFTGAVPVITLIAPNGGETYRLGDTMLVRWTFTNGISRMVRIGLSLNNGISYSVELTKEKAYFQTSENGALDYVIPDDTSLITPAARIEIVDYDVASIYAVSAAKFSIGPPSAAIRGASRTDESSFLILNGKKIECSVKNGTSTGRSALWLVSLKGQKMLLTPDISPGLITWKIPAMASGVYFAVGRINGRSETRRITILNKR